MSHTTTIAKVLITDIVAFRATINELKRRGVIKGELLENTKPRAYYENQAGMDQPADFCLRLDEARFDVGFYRTPDGKGLEARADLFGGGIDRILGVTPAEGDDPMQAKLGKLYQEYGAQVTERHFSQSGKSVQRIENADGSLQLVVTA